jgi:hypothetical protein
LLRNFYCDCNLPKISVETGGPDAKINRRAADHFMITFTMVEPDFWIQLKGNNAGQPLDHSIPNSIGIKVDQNVLVPKYLYYVFEYLHLSGQFKAYLKGSVIPFITRADIKTALARHFISVSPGYIIEFAEDSKQIAIEVPDDIGIAS